jgi:bifunctional non-homologous end joining protein LigD
MIIDGREIDISNEDKVFFPDDGIRKGDLIEYYRRMAERMRPYLAQRPVMMQRFPDGIDHEGFYQKQAADYFPGWMERIEVDLKQPGETRSMPVCSGAADLVYLANLATITLHVWLSRRPQLNRPDRMIFDLDPPGEDFAPVRAGARALHALLDKIGLAAFVMTTGSRGLHVTVPLRRENDFDDVRDFARGVARHLAAEAPGQFTLEQRKDRRGDRLFLDYLRNAYGQTAVAPYSVRPLPGAPVATPLDWEEISDRDLTSGRYRMGNIFRRLGQKEDPWKELPRRAHSLTGPRRRLNALQD